MLLYIAIAAVTVLAAAMVRVTEGAPRGSRGRAAGVTCLLMILLILALPAVLREETGNDYLRYVEFFHLISVDSYVPTESGFNLLVKLIYGLCGYENYLLVFAVFAVATIALMLFAIRQQAEDFLFSFFLFMMFGYYFQSFNTMRYYFALSVVMAASVCFLRKNYAAFVLLVLGASLFHKSALAALVLYPLAAHAWKKWELAALTALGAAAMVMHDEVLALLLRVYPSWADTADLAAGTGISWVNIAKCAAGILLALMVYYLRKSCAEEDGATRQLRLYVNASLLGLMIYVFGWFVPEVSRICYYLTYTQIFLFPMLLRRIPERYERVRRIFTAGVIAAALMYFAMFLRAAYGDTTKLLPYKSFLFHDLSQTPSGSIED